jgi:hypothetical protein
VGEQLVPCECCFFMEGLHRCTGVSACIVLGYRGNLRRLLASNVCSNSLLQHVVCHARCCACVVGYSDLYEISRWWLHAAA